MKPKKTSKAAERPTAPVSEKTEEITVGDEKIKNVCSDDNKPSVQSEKAKLSDGKKTVQTEPVLAESGAGEEHGCGQNGLQNLNGESDEMSGKTGLAAEGAPCEEQSARAVGEEKVFSESVFGALYALADRFPENDVARDVTSKAFRLFAAGKSGDITSVYEEYLAFRKAAAAEQIRKEVQSPSAPETSEDEQKCDVTKTASRSFSGFPGGTPPVDYGAALTARQMLIARQSGMSYREYAELLHSVPHGKRGIFGN